MSLKQKKIKDIKEMPKIIKRDIEELNRLSDEDLMSLFVFFKFLITDIKKENDVIFLTKRGSIIANHRAILLHKYGIKIKLAEEFLAG